MLTREKFCFLAFVCVFLYVLSISTDAFQFRSRRMQRKMRHRWKPSYLNTRCTNRRSCNFRRPAVLPVVSPDSRNEEATRADSPSGTGLSRNQQPPEADREGRDASGGPPGRRRGKRAVFAWPPDTLFIAQYSIEIPVYDPDGVQTPFLLEVPFEINLPNVTETIITGGARYLSGRATILGAMESLLARFGFDGKSCVLRAVCERAEADAVSQGLIGEILNIILRVSSADEDSPLLDAYKQAEYNGRTTGGCSCLYPRCPVSIFHFFE